MTDDRGHERATTRERREARAARLREWADKREVKAEAADEKAHAMADMIPFGQPILAGHYSQGRDQRYRDRIHDTTAKGFEHAAKAKQMNSKAGNIEAALAASVYDDDPDAVEALAARLCLLEAERARIKAYNVSCRKGTPDPSVLDDRQRAALISMARFSGQLRPNGAMPAYATSNLGGRINTTRQRIQRLKGEGAT